MAISWSSYLYTIICTIMDYCLIICKNVTMAQLGNYERKCVVVYGLSEGTTVLLMIVFQ